MNRRVLRRTALPTTLFIALGLTACGGGNEQAAAGGGEGGELSGEVVVDGSSTVEPLTSSAGEVFKEESPDVNVSVGTAGTGGGFEKFCNGEIDIADASRRIKDEEKASCEKTGITYL